MFTGSDETERLKNSCALARKKRQSDFTDDLEEDEFEPVEDLSYSPPVSISQASIQQQGAMVAEW